MKTQITAHMTEDEIMKAAEEFYENCVEAYKTAARFAVPATLEEYATLESSIEYIRRSVENKKTAEKYAKEKYQEFLDRLESAKHFDWEVGYIRRENSKTLNAKMFEYLAQMKNGEMTKEEYAAHGRETNCIAEGWNDALILAERTYRKNHGLPEKKTGLVVADWESRMVSELESKTDEEIM